MGPRGSNEQVGGGGIYQACCVSVVKDGTSLLSHIYNGCYDERPLVTESFYLDRGLQLSLNELAHTPHGTT